MQERRPYRSIKWFRLAVLVVGAYFVYICFTHQSQLADIRRETEASRQQVEQLQQTKAALLEERNLLQDRRYIEKVAREELGLVKPGEMPYIPAAKN